MTTTATTAARERLAQLVWRALDAVHDPELDRPVTDLRFVRSVEVDDDGTARVALRLPTWFCAPNFGYLMVADALDAVRGVEGVTSAAIRLDDHFASDEINAGVAGGRGFTGSFPGMAEAELDDLRVTFWRKAHAAAQERAAALVLRTGAAAGVHELPGACLRDVPAGEHRDRLVRRRRALGFAHTDDAPLLLDDVGEPVASVEVERHLRIGRLTRVSIEGNAALCSGLLSARYGLALDEEDANP